METDYLMEKTLAELDHNLHDRYRNCVVVSNRMLSRYEGVFPDFTDHTTLHALEIVDYCNRIIGDRIADLTADDLYVLLMGAAFHDVGMGVSGKDFAEFLPIVCPGVPMPETQAEIQTLVRKNHQEFSACYVRKYWELFDLPNERYAQAVIQVCRGHRKTDLFDPAGYPQPFPVGEGRTVCLTYLAALVRLSDELDIAADRNFSFLYDPEHMVHAIDRFMFKKHKAIKRVEVLPDHIAVFAGTDDPAIHDGIRETVEKLADTLDYCRRVTAERTPFVIPQERVELELKALWEGGAAV